MAFRTFRLSLFVAAVALVVAFVYGGTKGLALCAILGVLEVSLSFDNAVVNATVLQRMSEFWQRIFLTVGVLVAVVGMRLVFPLLVVGLTAHLGPVEAVRLALDKGDPKTSGTYGYLLNEAHPVIAAFGGIFLLLLFLDFVFEEREVSWLVWIERPLARIGQLEALSVIVAGAALVLAARLLAHRDQEASVLVAGVIGMVTYLAVNALGTFFETGGGTDEDGGYAPGISGSAESIAETVEATGGPVAVAEAVVGRSALVLATGKAAFFLFLYIEVLDASFSFDGVVGAFAITADPIIIALGLGFIGAMFVRSLTVYLVRQGTLSEYVYLEHGAHWAIGALAVILLISMKVDVPQVVTGLIGVAFIAAAFVSSARRKNDDEVEPTPVLTGA